MFKYFKKHIIELIASFYVIFLACINPFSGFYLFLRAVPYYVRIPFLLDLDFFYFYYYHVFYNFARYTAEKGKTNITDIGELTYGETPYYSLVKIFKYIPVKPSDVFYDLGCGRGKLVFFVRKYYKLTSFGVDIIPTFIKVANRFATLKKVDKVAFFEANFKKFDFSKGTIFFIAWTCLNEPTVKSMILSLLKIPSGSYVITTSFPIKHECFKVVKKLRVNYSWGRGNLFLNQKI